MTAAAYLVIYLWWLGTAIGSSAVAVPMPSMEARHNAQESMKAATEDAASRSARAWTHCIPATEKRP